MESLLKPPAKPPTTDQQVRDLLTRAGMLHDNGRFMDAFDLVSEAIRVNPQWAPSWCMAAVLDLQLGRFHTAEASARAAMRIDPGNVMAHTHLAMILYAQGKGIEAWNMIDHARKKFPEDLDARYFSAWIRLGCGDYSGWDTYDTRLKRADGMRRPMLFPVWDGVAKINSLLIVAEQGVGDEILFATVFNRVKRFNPHLRIGIECDIRFKDLFARSFPWARIYPSKHRQLPEWKDDQYDAMIFEGSLPQYFRKTAADFEGCVRQTLKPRDGSLRWEFDPSKKHVGLCWRGGASLTCTNLRSIPHNQLITAVTAAFPEVDFHNLQVDGQQEFAMSGPYVDIFSNFDDLAAYIAGLDAVVTVTCSIVHFAGALDVPTLILTPVNPQWRYQLAGNKMPWYSSVELIRQQKAFEWSSPVSIAVEKLGVILGLKPVTVNC